MCVCIPQQFLRSGINQEFLWHDMKIMDEQIQGVEMARKQETRNSKKDRS